MLCISDNCAYLETNFSISEINAFLLLKLVFSKDLKSKLITLSMKPRSQCIFWRNAWSCSFVVFMLCSEANLKPDIISLSISILALSNELNIHSHLFAYLNMNVIPQGSQVELPYHQLMLQVWAKGILPYHSW